MMSAAFIICSMFYSALLLIVYFSKKRLSTKENEVYQMLTITNFFGLVIALFCYLITLNRDSFPMLTSIINRAYLIYLLTWLMLFVYYTFLISFKKKIDLHFNSNELYRKIGSIFFRVYLVIAIALLVLPLYYTNNDLNSVYSYGPGSILCTVMSGVCILASLIFMLKGRKDVKKEKFIPLISYIIIFPIVIFIQYRYPELLLTTSVETFITFLLYFTIENPDMRIIDELSDAKKRLEKSNDTKTEFLHSISHEIRTPLTNILGFTDSLNEKNLTPDVRNDVDNISYSANSLLKVVNGMLDVSKLDNNKIQIVEKNYNVKSMLEELGDFGKEVIDRKPIEVRTFFDASIPEALKGDYVILRQIILNLLGNAIERTKYGYIEFSVTSITKNDVCRLIISLEDTGGVIKQSKLENIFNSDEDVTSESLIEGVSTSLTATKKLVDLMGGTIVAQNVYGRGCKITVSLDQEIIHLTRENKEELLNPYVKDITGKRVLIVDDNKLNIKVAERLLEKYNVEIDSVLSGIECINRINSGSRYDLILMDDMMPNMSGVETFKTLKQNPNFTTPTVMLTANAIEGQKEKYLLQDGFDEYIAKPIAKSELERVIDKLF